MKYILILLMSIQLQASAKLDAVKKPVNKTQVCDVYYTSFVTSLDIYQETKSCYDVKYSTLSFAQLVLNNCDLDQDDFEIAEYAQKLEEQCKSQSAN